MQKFETNKIQYLSIRGNDNQNRILIFLPGIGAIKENYFVYAKSIAQNYNKTYILDLPEQGSKGKWTIGTMADNLREFIKEKDRDSIKEIHLAGHSAGAIAVLSFMYNYNSKIENYFINNLAKESNKNIIFKKAKAIGFIKTFTEKKKITRLILYAPIDEFEVVVSKKVIKIISKLNEYFLKIIFNFFVNLPMLIINKLGKYKYVKIKLSKNCKLQYFGLKINDTKSFFEYIYNYTTIFQLYQYFENNEKTQLSNVLTDKQIIIHYGSKDWLLKSLKRNKVKMLVNFRMHNEFEIIEHKKLGHLLANEFNLDINLNSQMLTNKNVTIN